MHKAKQMVALVQAPSEMLPESANNSSKLNLSTSVQACAGIPGTVPSLLVRLYSHTRILSGVRVGSLLRSLSGGPGVSRPLKQHTASDGILPHLQTPSPPQSLCLITHLRMHVAALCMRIMLAGCSTLPSCSGTAVLLSQSISSERHSSRDEDSRCCSDTRGRHVWGLCADVCACEHTVGLRHSLGFQSLSAHSLGNHTTAVSG